LQATVKIPLQIQYESRRELRALATFYSLKHYNYAGRLHNFNKDIAKYAAGFNLSARQLKQRVADLLIMDLVKFDGHTLQLKGFKKIAREKNYNLRAFTFAAGEPELIKLHIYKIKINQNLKKQKFAYDKKKIIFETTNIKALIENPELINGEYCNEVINVKKLLANKASQRSNKNIKKLASRLNKYNGDALDAKHWRALEIGLKTGFKAWPFANPDLTLSNAGLARVCLNSTAVSTGHKIKRELAANGLLEATPRRVANVDRPTIERGKTYDLIEAGTIYNRGAQNCGVYTSKQLKTVANDGRIFSARNKRLPRRWVDLHQRTISSLITLKPL